MPPVAAASSYYFNGNIIVLYQSLQRYLSSTGTKYNYKEAFIPQVGLKCVRGCEVEGMLDGNGRVIEDGPEPRPILPGDQRTYRVWLDSNQYFIDMNNTDDGKDDVYGGKNIKIDFSVT